jgi:hypothetical protein
VRASKVDLDNPLLMSSLHSKLQRKIVAYREEFAMFLG